MEKQFELSTRNIFVNVGEDNKVTLYVLNNDRTMARTIDEFAAKEGGKEATNVTAEHIYFAKRKIEKKYERQISETRRWQFGYRQIINDLKDKQIKEIDKFLEKYRTLLKSPKLDVYQSENYDYDWYDDTESCEYSYEYMSLSEDAPKADFIIKGENQVNLLQVDKFLNKEMAPLTTIKELKDLQANIEEKLIADAKSQKEKQDAHKKADKEKEELRARTEEYLNY